MFLVLFAANPALATLEDMAGVFFDEDSYLYCLDGVVPFASFDAFILLLEPSMDAVRGFGFRLNVDGEFFLTGIDYPAGLIIQGTSLINEDALIYFSEPLPCTPITILMTATFLYSDSDGDPLFFYLRGAESVLPGGLPVVLLEDGETLFPVEVAMGLESPTAVVNECYPDADEAVSWGAVKGLYR
jgi:hypothetical protein